jgi:hypothetical protein
MRRNYTQSCLCDIWESVHSIEREYIIVAPSSNREKQGHFWYIHSIEIEDPEDVTILVPRGFANESNPQQYPSIVKRGKKLELDRCPLDRVLDRSLFTLSIAPLQLQSLPTKSELSNQKSAIPPNSNSQSDSPITTAPTQSE